MLKLVGLKGDLDADAAAAFPKAKDLLDITTEKKQQHASSAFLHIAQTCRDKIRAAAERDNTHTVIKVPEILMGQPLFDHVDMVKRIVELLQRNGYVVMRITTHHILVSWDSVFLRPSTIASTPALPAAVAALSPSGQNSGPITVFKPISSFRLHPEFKLSVPLTGPCSTRWIQ